MKVTVVIDAPNDEIFGVYKGTKSSVRNKFIQEEMETSGYSKEESTGLIDEMYEFEQFALIL